MRHPAVLAIVVALAAGAVSMTGAAAASHPTEKAAAQDAAFPSWSPDGKQIAFAYVAPSRRYRIVRTSSKPGGAIHTVLAARGFCCEELQWAAPGRILANPNSRLKSVGVPRGKAKRLFFSSSSCDNSYGCQTQGFILSPDRKYAAAAIASDWSDPHSPWGIGLLKLTPGRRPAVLPSPLTAEENATGCYPDQVMGTVCGWTTDRALAFSPDGTGLIFQRTVWDGWRTGPPALRAIHFGGGTSVPLEQSRIPGAALVPSDVQQAQWSPNGSWVAYVVANASTDWNQSLDVVPTGGGTPRVLATCGIDSEFGFSWSPSSKVLSYGCASETSQSSQFMTVRPDGTHLTDLLKEHPLAYVQRFLASGPQWSPDGSRLLFLAHGINKVRTHVWTVRPNGRDLVRLG